MFDNDTLIVSYDEKRGEGTNGRAKVQKGLKTADERHEAGVGDCIDCGYCVQVCPTGIDIRRGLQIQCVHCALCIDACNTIMDKMEWPHGLIRYTSDNELKGKRTHFFKAKNIGYGVALIAAIGVLVWGVFSQAPMDAAVRKVRQPMYVTLSDGRIQNSYEIKINNKTQKPVVIDIRLHGLEGAVLDLGRFEHLMLEAEGSARVLALVKYAVPVADQKQFDFDFEFVPEESSGIEPFQQPSSFFAP
jgi:cytochrome c oxidase accessory protein FixG